MNKKDKLRRWNKVLLLKAKRVNDHILVDCFNEKLNQSTKQPIQVNIRLFRKLYQSKRDNTLLGYEMASLMGGDGECDAIIFGNYEYDLIRDIESTIKTLNYSPHSILKKVNKLLDKLKPKSGTNWRLDYESFEWLQLQKALIDLCNPFNSL